MVVGRRIVIVDLVEDLSVGFEGTETVREAWRNIDLAPVFGTHLGHCELAIGRRTDANIDNDIDDRAVKHAQELGLGVRRRLEMQAPHDAALARERVIVLHEFVDDTKFRVAAFAEGFREKTARIAIAFGRKEKHVVEQGRGYFHRKVLSGLRSSVSVRSISASGAMVTVSASSRRRGAIR